MAKARKSDKGFLLIDCDAMETVTGFGGIGICDECGEPSAEGTYVAVINRWLCPKCFEEWEKDAEYCIEDARIERKNFDFYCNEFRISNGI